ncbi:M55 family metallopeptidase [Kribbella sp. NBC_01245]|uniref:M55 family metallopeptidase n=1 Tax=Kribbella sp. NBC_01245 TaxID=2903578 RepID=UPI002E281FFE|nr:M55 family metallopeptidase [Kribbella sp. NBC_01245]
MKVYISVDMEGIAGIATLDQIVQGQAGYAAAQALMTAETNAAILGAVEAGASEVTVSDSHGRMDNLLHAELDPRARLVFGTPRAQCMAHGLTPDFDVALFVGYHAPGGAPGVLAHTFSSEFARMRVNGREVSEAEVNALYAASRGVPVGLITGDDQICELAAKVIPGVGTAEVKTAEGWNATNSVSPSVARELIQEGASLAVQSASSLSPLAVPDDLIVELDLQIPEAAELLAFIPGSERLGELTVRQQVADIDELLALITVWYQLAAAARRGRAALTARR